MTSVTSRHAGTSKPISRQCCRAREKFRGVCAVKWSIFAVAILLAAAAPLVPRVLAQGSMPHIATVDPASGKSDDTVTLTGTNLGKSSVAGVYLSDDKNDYKAALVDQADGKLVFKVPQVKPGPYNVSVQSNGQILILPVRFTIQE